MQLENWFQCVEQWLLADAPFKFLQLGGDQCVFHAQDGDEVLILFLHVDDVICLASNIKMKEVLFKAIAERFDFEDKGELQHSLGMNITRDGGAFRMTLDMKAHIKDKLGLFNLDNH